MTELEISQKTKMLIENGSSDFIKKLYNLMPTHVEYVGDILNEDTKTVEGIRTVFLRSIYAYELIKEYPEENIRVSNACVDALSEISGKGNTAKMVRFFDLSRIIATTLFSIINKNEDEKHIKSYEQILMPTIPKPETTTSSQQPIYVKKTIGEADVVSYDPSKMNYDLPYEFNFANMDLVLIKSKKNDEIHIYSKNQEDSGK